MLNRLISSYFSNLLRPSLTESMKDKMRRLYKSHTIRSYTAARQIMYNEADCSNDKIFLIYGGNTFSWKCHGNSIPSADFVNAEHVVPQSSFQKNQPMVSDLHHLFSAPQPLNELRSNYPFSEFSYDQCYKFCQGQSCSTTRPSNPDDYSCLGLNPKLWMPRKADRGVIARAVLYFYTMYDYDISTVGSLSTFLKWNKNYPPSSREVLRNNILNSTQGNRNPFIDHPELADQVFSS